MVTDNYISTTLKPEFEIYGRLPAEAGNTLFLKSAIEAVQNIIDETLTDTTVTGQKRIAVFALALYYYNNRDFQGKTANMAIMQYVRNLLAKDFKLDRWVPEKE